MSDQPDPFARMVALWTEGARTYGDAFGAWCEAAQQAAAAAAGQGGDPAAALQGFGEQLGRAVAELSRLQSGFLETLLHNLPEASQQRLRAQSFSQLSRMADANWEAETRRLSEVLPEMGQRMQAADPQRIAVLMQSMVAEYLADLEALKQDAFHIDFKPVAEAWARVASGQADEGATRAIERLLRAMATKLKHGAEFYADPDATPVGQTPRERVHREGRFELYRYTPADDAPRQGPPVLIVYSVINRPYILDLVPGFSFIEHLLARGLDVYLVEWGETEPGDRETTLDAYIDPGLRGCVAAIKQRTGAERVSLFGHCIGGNLAIPYAALFPEDVDRMVALTVPITPAGGGVVALWTDREVFPVDAIVESYGLMPAKLIRYTFMALKPYYEVIKWKMFLENLGNEQAMALFMPVDHWANENVDIPAEVFRKFVEDVFHEERFARSEMRINGERVALDRITCPLLTLAASKDWIVPPESAAVLNELVGSEDKRFTLIEGAHVGIMIDPKARKHWDAIAEFLLGESG